MELISEKGEWSGTKQIVVRLGRILMGYAVAVLVATTIVLLPFGLFTSWGASIWVFGVFITATTAFFPTMFFVLVNETKGRLGPYGHMFSGAGVALAAHLVFLAFEGSFLTRGTDSSLIFLSMIGGAAGALAYWKIAVAYLQDNPFRVNIRKVTQVF